MSGQRLRGETLTLQLGDFSNCVCAHLWNAKQLVLESEEESENIDEEAYFHKSLSGVLSPRCISSDLFGNIGPKYTPNFEDVDLSNAWSGDLILPQHLAGLSNSVRYAYLHICNNC